MQFQESLCSELIFSLYYLEPWWWSNHWYD